MIITSFSLRFIKNKRIIFQSCYNYVHHWEGYVSGPPCSDILMRHITRYMDENKDYITAQRDTDADFRYFIFKLIANVSYDVISSCVYLGPVSKTLKHVHASAMEELRRPGYISQREFEEEQNALNSIVEERMKTAFSDLYEARKKLEDSYKRDNSEESQ